MNKESTILLAPVETTRASQAIYDQIVQLIVSGELRPGDRLPSERQMMDMMQRSRPTIREALRMLERNGLIQIVPGSSGAVVVEPSAASVEEPLETMLNMSHLSSLELLEYRELNEMATVGWAAERRTEADLERIRKCLQAFSSAADDFHEFAHYDSSFHQAIAKAGHNRVATMVDKVLHQLVLNILHQAYERKDAAQRKAMMDEILASHQSIYTAIAAGDPALARQTMRSHMRMFEKDVTDKE